MSLKQYEKGEEDSPVWRDVWALMEHLEREYRGRCVVEMGRATFAKGVGSVEVSFRRNRGRSDWHNLAYTVGRWPTTGHRTMCSLLVRLLWALEDAIVQADERGWSQEMMPEGIIPPPPAGA